LTVRDYFESVTAVDDWMADLAAAGELTPESVDRIVSLHGERGQRAIEAVGEHRVKEYRDFTVVVGYEDEYIVEGGGCICADSEYNLDPDDPAQLCWHALAVRVAEAIDEVDHHDMWYSDVRDFL
jgi:predicted nucleic acid-binding Zn finger protein